MADLSGPELLLWERFPRGAWVNLDDANTGSRDVGTTDPWGPDRMIRAEVIQALLLGADQTDPGFIPGVRLRGARITGRINLTGASIPAFLIYDHCQFDEEILLSECSTGAVRIVNSKFPAFDGTMMRVDGIISLKACSNVAVVRLEQARVTGQVCLADAAIGDNTSTVAVSADGMTVDGDVNCVGLVTRGAVSMQGIQVTGSIDFTNARITRPGPRALAVGNASIGGRLIGRGLQVVGEALLHDTSVTRVELSGAHLHHPGGLALSGGGLVVRGGMFCGNGFTAHGPVSLVGARLGANLNFNKSTLTNPGEVALRLDRATIGNFDGSDLDCSGWIRLVGARVASDASFERAQIDGGGAHAIVADGMKIDGTLRLAGMRAHGEVTIRTGRVGQRLILTDAQLVNPSGTALALSRTEIVSDLFCKNIRLTGATRLTGVRVGGHLDLDQVRLIYPGGKALHGRAMQAGEFSLRPAEPIQGIVDLSHARVGVFRDDPSCWPAELVLDGFIYSAMEPQLPAKVRLNWLGRHNHGQPLQPYEQLAAYYNGLGQPAEARRILYVRERLQRTSQPPLARTWNFLQDVTVAYGYQPWRAAAWFALLLAVGSTIFTINPPPPFQTGAAPHFNAVIYTLDLLLPIVDLGQEHAFNPSGVEQWFSYLLIAAGWVLATTIAAGVARVISRR